MKRTLCTGGLLIGEFATQGAALWSSTTSAVETALPIICGLTWVVSAYLFARSFCISLKEQSATFSDPLTEVDLK
jgi:hypothetical protein